MKTRLHRMETLGPVFSAYYEMQRPRFEGEIAFWQSLVKPGISVLEIGAGTGYLSTEVAKQRPGKLTLVEPNRYFAKRLRQRMKPYRKYCPTKIQVSLFEEGKFPKQDLIIFAYDSLALLHEKEQRLKFFKAVHQTLSPEGRFVVHFVTPQAIKKVLKSYGDWKTGQVKTPLGIIEFRKFGKLGRGYYTFYLEVRSVRMGRVEKYQLKIALLTPTSVVALARKAGLRQIARYSDYAKNRSPRPAMQIAVFGRK